jgi:hypothetical protein
VYGRQPKDQVLPNSRGCEFDRRWGNSEDGLGVAQTLRHSLDFWGPSARYDLPFCWRVRSADLAKAITL